jgi:hypothetical protein
MADWLGRGTPSRRRWAIIAALVAIMLMVAQLSGQSP